MCGRFSLFVPVEDVEDRFGATVTFDFRPRYNAAPGQKLAVIPDVRPDAICQMEWGLLPPWADTRQDGGIINARAETVSEKRSFRDAFHQHSGGEMEDGDADDGGVGDADVGEVGDGDGRSAGRCLVLADGFYEWTTVDGDRLPYRVTLDDGEPFAMAGLWQRWWPAERQSGLAEFQRGTAEDAAPVDAFAIVTTEPNDVVADLHDRMPVVLGRGDEERWLTEGPDAVRECFDPYPADEMRAYRVSTAVNDPTNDVPDVVEPVSDGVG